MKDNLLRDMKVISHDEHVDLSCALLCHTTSLELSQHIYLSLQQVGMTSKSCSLLRTASHHELVEKFLESCRKIFGKHIKYHLKPTL